MADLSFSSVPQGILQLFNTGATVDGSAPSEVGAVLTAYYKTYSGLAAGGLFTFGNTKPMTILGVEIACPGATNASIYVTDGIADALGMDVPISTGSMSGGKYNYQKGASTLFILPGQKMRVVLTGSLSGAGRILVKAVLTGTEYGSYT